MGIGDTLAPVINTLPGMFGIPSIPGIGDSTSKNVASPSGVRDTVSKALAGDYYGSSGAGQRGGYTNYFMPPRAGVDQINEPIAASASVSFGKTALWAGGGLLVLWLLLK